MKKLFTKLWFCLILLLVVNLFAQVKLPKLISNGMVIQREKPIKIWGWASGSEEIQISFNKITKKIIANNSGNWEVEYPQMNAGGPYEMIIKASNIIKLNDIMIGDVWICSGQSNMELPMKRVSWKYPDEIENSENNYLRQFYVPREWNFKEPQKDLSEGSWKSANPENTPDFSATAYFFGKELYERHKVPIGLINTSFGGSRVQCWISEESLSKFPIYHNEAIMFRDDELIRKIEVADKAISDSWYKLLSKKDKGYQDKNNSWFQDELDTKYWDTMNVPGYWANNNLGLVNGSVWFRKKINLNKELAEQTATLILGRIVDADSTFVNGKFVGNVTYQYPPRRYEIPLDVLKEGENLIAIRVVSNSGKGGFILDKEYLLEFADTTINLESEWKYKLGAEMPALPIQTFIRLKSLGLYNSMIAPILNLNIKGVIWYQGESNAWNPKEYYDLFSTLIWDWREKWNDKRLPFLYVQLPNFMEPIPYPSESSWAELREAQLQALSVENTGMAITIDIGEWNDIHPLNKKDVGYRLSLLAEKIVYKKDDIVYSGPIYNSMKIEENKIIISFNHIGKSLIAKGEKELKGFSIAGEDKKFVWANAKIENDKIIVWSNIINKPIAVRYAWADNPDEANLFNSKGLPASPFRTDEF